MVGRTRSLLSPVRLALGLDAGCELAGALVLSLASGRIADLFNVDSAYAQARRCRLLAGSDRRRVCRPYRHREPRAGLALAAGNIFAGIAGWLVFAAFKDELDPGGRWLLTAAADTFIVIGLLEILALRRTPAPDQQLLVHGSERPQEVHQVPDLFLESRSSLPHARMALPATPSWMKVKIAPSVCCRGTCTVRSSGYGLRSRPWGYATLSVAARAVLLEQRPPRRD